MVAYVFDLSRYASNALGHSQRGVGGIRQANRQLPNSNVDIERTGESRERKPEVQEKQQRVATEALDRRKVNQRIFHQRVLFDLRSGSERRRRNQRESDIVEHINLII